MRVLLLWLCLVGSAWAVPTVTRHADELAQFPEFMRVGDDPKAVCCDELWETDSARDGTYTFCANCAKTDPCRCWTNVDVGEPGAFARRIDARWVCTEAGTEMCPCGGTPGCTPDGGACENNIDCCDARCVGGVCGGCLPFGGTCIIDADCCADPCVNGQCGGVTTTTSTTSSTSTSTGAVSTTSTSTVTTTSSTLALTSPVAILPPFPGTSMSGNSAGADVLACTVVLLPAGVVNATHISTAFQGGGNCGIGIYPDDDLAGPLATTTKTCPTNGVVTDTVTAFTLFGGAQYRFCECTDNVLTGNLGLWAAPVTNNMVARLQNAFSLSTGFATEHCMGGAPPGMTGPLVTNPFAIQPFITVEQ